MLLMLHHNATKKIYELHLFLCELPCIGLRKRSVDMCHYNLHLTNLGKQERIPWELVYTCVDV